MVPSLQFWITKLWLSYTLKNVPKNLPRCLLSPPLISKFCLLSVKKLDFPSFRKGSICGGVYNSQPPPVPLQPSLSQLDEFSLSGSILSSDQIREFTFFFHVFAISLFHLISFALRSLGYIHLIWVAYWSFKFEDYLHSAKTHEGVLWSVSNYAVSVLSIGFLYWMSTLQGFINNLPCCLIASCYRV